MKLIFFLMSLVLYCQEPAYVTDYHSLDGRKSEKRFIENYSNSTEVNVLAYVLSLKMKSAKYAFFPWKKLSIFNNAKKQLITLIKSNPENPNLRYVRLVIQENIPKFLGYSDDIEADKKFLIHLMEKKDNFDYLDKYIKINTSL